MEMLLTLSWEEGLIVSVVLAFEIMTLKYASRV